MSPTNLTLLSQAVGDGLGHFLLHRPNMTRKLHKALKTAELKLHLGYGEHTQMALVLSQLLSAVDKPHYSAQFSTKIKETLPRFPKEYIRDSHNLIAYLAKLKAHQNESLSVAILFGSLCTRFDSMSKLLPWLLGYASMLNKKPYAIAGHIFFGLYMFCRKNGSTPNDFLQTFAKWRKSSQALQSPVPDQIYWAYQQALWIGLNFNRRPMMEFIGQHLSSTFAAPSSSCVLSMIPFSIVLAEEKKDLQDLCIYLSEPGSVIAKSDLMMLGMLSAQIIGISTDKLPSWLSVHNQDLLITPESWYTKAEKAPVKAYVRFPPPPKKEDTQLRLF